MDICNIKVEKWENMLSKERVKDYFKDLDVFLKNEINIYGESLEIFPNRDNIFNCLNKCSIEDLKV